MQRLTNASDKTTDVDSRLAAALYAATLPPAPPVTTSIDALLNHGRQELHAIPDATTDIECHLIQALQEIDLGPQVGTSSEE